MLDNIRSPYAQNAIRTFGLAYRQDNAIIPEAFYSENQINDRYITRNMVFLGVVGLKDPIRPEVPAAIKKIQRAGVKVRMITDVVIETAMANAKECGILDKNCKEEYDVMEGNDFSTKVQYFVELKNVTVRDIRRRPLSLLHIGNIINSLDILLFSSISNICYSHCSSN